MSANFRRYVAIERDYQRLRIYEQWPSLHKHSEKFEYLYQHYEDQGIPTVESINWLIQEAQIELPKDPYLPPPLYWYVQFEPWFYDEAKSRLELGTVAESTLWAQISDASFVLYFTANNGSADAEWQYRAERGEHLCSTPDHTRLNETSKLHWKSSGNKQTTPGYDQNDVKTSITVDKDWTENQAQFLRTVVRLLKRFPGLQMRHLKGSEEIVQVHPSHDKLPFIEEWTRSSLATSDNEMSQIVADFKQEFSNDQKNKPEIPEEETGGGAESEHTRSPLAAVLEKPHTAAAIFEQAIEDDQVIPAESTEDQTIVDAQSRGESPSAFMEMVELPSDDDFEMPDATGEPIKSPPQSPLPSSHETNTLQSDRLRSSFRWATFMNRDDGPKNAESLFPDTKTRFRSHRRHLGGFEPR